MIIPFEFVLDELHRLNPRVKSMFGAVAVYVGTKIIFILRDRLSYPEDNGVWVVTTNEDFDSLKQDLPSLRTINLFKDVKMSWKIIPVSSENFEAEVSKACSLVLSRDPRIGKVPKVSVKKNKGKDKTNLKNSSSQIKNHKKKTRKKSKLKTKIETKSKRTRK